MAQTPVNVHSNRLSLRGLVINQPIWTCKFYRELCFFWLQTVRLNHLDQSAMFYRLGAILGPFPCASAARFAESPLWPPFQLYWVKPCLRASNTIPSAWGETSITIPPFFQTKQCMKGVCLYRWISTWEDHATKCCLICSLNPHPWPPLIWTRHFGCST